MAQPRSVATRATMSLRRFLPDGFILALLGTVAAASLFPAEGSVLRRAGDLSTLLIVALFFFHGLRLKREAVVQGFLRWRLHLAILAFGFLLMPLIGLGFSAAGARLLTPELWLGVLFLCALPTTVQSSIAYASLARGNVAASVVASAASNILAVVLTPLVFALVAQQAGGIGDPSAIGRVALQLLLPFAVGQLARRWLAGWIARHGAIVARLDRITILLAVYVAFSEAVAGGLWEALDATTLIVLTAVVTLLLIVAFAAAWWAGRRLGFDQPDRATFLFAAAHKSLATGAPMIRILFPGAEAGAMLLPLILYHQLQLMLSAVLAGRMGGEPDPSNSSSRT